MAIDQGGYPARLSVDYPEHLNRLTTLLRLLAAIPILVILGLLSATGDPKPAWSAFKAYGARGVG